jgi:hypothetical protein
MSRFYRKDHYFRLNGSTVVLFEAVPLFAIDFDDPEHIAITIDELEIMSRHIDSECVDYDIISIYVSFVYRNYYCYAT